MANLTIVVDVRELPNGEWQTMSSYRVPQSDMVVFVNAAQNGGDLVITPKPPAKTLPFCENNGKTPKTLPPVKYNQPEVVKICDDFAGKEFLYTAQIGTALPEDPIVIIEKAKLNFMFDAGSFLLGAGIAAALTYLIVKSRANKMRPQQG